MDGLRMIAVDVTVRDASLIGQSGHMRPGTRGELPIAKLHRLKRHSFRHSPLGKILSFLIRPGGQCTKTMIGPLSVAHQAGKRLCP